MRPFLPILSAAFAVLGPGIANAHDAPRVVASIKPVHSLVAGVMDGVGEPHLLIAGAQSPHTFAMRPTDARALNDADVVFWIGEQVETFLPRAIASVGGLQAVSLIEAPGLVLYEYEDGHDGHAPEHGHAHGHNGNHGHRHGHNDTHDPGHGHGHDHAHGEDRHHDHDHDHTGVDGHIWLDPANARAMVASIAGTLSQIDPDHADTYAANAAALSERLVALENETTERLAPYRAIPFYTFHEAFRYFAERFGLDSRGAITVTPEVQPGAQRLESIRTEVAGHERACILAEPQFPPRLVEVVVEGTGARQGTVDPLGADLADGPDLYFELIETNAAAFEECFASTM